MAVVTSCSAISAARRGQLPPSDTAYSFIEAALDRRMSAFQSSSDNSVIASPERPMRRTGRTGPLSGPTRKRRPAVQDGTNERAVRTMRFE